MFSDPLLNQHFFRSFSEELKKTATVVDPHAAEEMAKKFISKRDLAMMAAGAGGLYGTTRVAKDIVAGEQIRKQQQGQY